MLQKNSSMADRMSLVSVLKEWCETLNPAVFEQLFPDGTDKCLALINSATNDEDTFIVRLSKALTGLRIEDWDANMQNLFITRLNQCKKTAEDFHIHIVTEKIPEVNSYQLTYAEDNGNSVTKRFDRVEITKRGKLLHNQITHDLDAMGHAISEQEKRQTKCKTILAVQFNHIALMHAYRITCGHRNADRVAVKRNLRMTSTADTPFTGGAGAFAKNTHRCFSVSGRKHGSGCFHGIPPFQARIDLAIVFQFL